MSIEIRNQQRKYKIDISLIRERSEDILNLCGLEGSDLSILIVNNRTMRDLNRNYRGIDSPTDVLAFPMIDSTKTAPLSAKNMRDSELPPSLLGDVVLSIEKINAQAAEQGHSEDHEFLILLIHGILHLIGYDHERSASEKRRMQKKEALILSALISMRERDRGAA